LATCANLALAGLSFEKTRLDLNVAPGTKALDASYAFTNTGSNPVKVLDILSSCGCTVPELTQRNYGPGEAGVLKVKFEIGDRQGLQSKTITLRTDAGEYALQLVANIPQRLVISPRLVVFRAGDTGERSIRLSFNSDTPFSKVRLTEVAPPFVATLSTDKEGLEYTVTVKVEGKATADQRSTCFVRSTSASGLEYTDALFFRYLP
jgi:hypothetical protein